MRQKIAKGMLDLKNRVAGGGAPKIEKGAEEETPESAAQPSAKEPPEQAP